MAKDVEIKGVVYDDVPQVDLPITNSQNKAHFMDTDDATLNSAAQLDDGVTAYAGGVKYTGTTPARSSADLTVSGDTVTVPAGKYTVAATKAVASGSAKPPTSVSATGASVSTGSNTLTLTKSVSITPVVTAGYVSSGTAQSSSVTLTATVTTKAAATLQPSTSAVTIAADTYLTGAQTIPAEPNYVAANIVSGKSLWGLNGSAQVPTISQDSVTKILTIS